MAENPEATSTTYGEIPSGDVLVPRPRAPSGEKLVNEVEFLGLLPKTGNDQWDCETGNYYVALSLQQ